MPTLVVTVQGAMLRCRDGQVIVEQEGHTLQRMPENQVERALLLGSVGMTTGFVNLALERRVPVTFLSQFGQYKGRLDPGGLRDVELRLAQYRKLEDLVWRLDIAREIVRAKVGNQRRLLLRSHRNAPSEAIRTTAQELAAIVERLPKARTLPQLMGMEGLAAREYFKALPNALRKPMRFIGRSRRPPRDPMNALLSLGYGLLTAEIIGALAGVGLDPQIGIFHSSRGRMPALAEDVLEMFRAPVSDALALALVNLGTLQEEDFATTESGGVVLQKRALEVYFKQYRRRMQATFRDRAGKPTSFRHELQSHAAHLRRVILRKETYCTFVAPDGGPARHG